MEGREEFARRSGLISRAWVWMTWPNHTALITGVDASGHPVMANGRIVFPPDGGAAAEEPRTRAG